MENCKPRPGLNRISVDNFTAEDVKNKLRIDQSSPFIGISFTNNGDLNLLIPENEFQENPLNLKPQEFINIITAVFLVTQGSKTVTVSASSGTAGESVTSSMPF